MENKVKVGELYTLKELCILHDLDYKDSTNCRKAILSILGTMYKLEVTGKGRGRRFKILEVYSTPQGKNDKRKKGNHTKYLDYYIRLLSLFEVSSEKKMEVLIQETLGINMNDFIEEELSYFDEKGEKQDIRGAKSRNRYRKELYNEIYSYYVKALTRLENEGKIGKSKYRQVHDLEARRERYATKEEETEIERIRKETLKDMEIKPQKLFFDEELNELFNTELRNRYAEKLKLTVYGNYFCIRPTKTIKKLNHEREVIEARYELKKILELRGWKIISKKREYKKKKTIGLKLNDNYNSQYEIKKDTEKWNLMNIYTQEFHNSLWNVNRTLEEHFFDLELLLITIPQTEREGFLLKELDKRNVTYLQWEEGYHQRFQAREKEKEQELQRCPENQEPFVEKVKETTNNSLLDSSNIQVGMVFPTLSKLYKALGIQDTPKGSKAEAIRQEVSKLLLYKKTGKISRGKVTNEIIIVEIYNRSQENAI